MASERNIEINYFYTYVEYVHAKTLDRSASCIKSTQTSSESTSIKKVYKYVE